MASSPNLFVRWTHAPRHSNRGGSDAIRRLRANDYPANIVMPQPVTALTSLPAGLVSPGIHAIYSRYGDNKPLVVYVLEGDFALWVDAGINVTPDQHVIPYLRDKAAALWRKPQVVLLTHADVDHFGGVAQLRRARPDALVMCHALDQPWIESEDLIFQRRYEMHADEGIVLSPERRRVLRERGGGGAKVQVSLQSGEVIDLGGGSRWSVLSAPGHTPGHVVLWNDVSGDLILGDAALDWGVPNAADGLLAVPPYYDVPAYESTIEMLRGLEPRRVFTSHQGILDQSQAAQLFRNSLEAVRTIGEAMKDALRAATSRLTLAELCREVGRRSAIWPEALWPGLADPISAHLKMAAARGEVGREVTGHYRLSK